MEGNYWERKEELRELQLNFKWMEFQSHVGGGGDGIVLLLFSRCLFNSSVFRPGNITRFCSCHDFDIK